MIIEMIKPLSRKRAIVVSIISVLILVSLLISYKVYMNHIYMQKASTLRLEMAKLSLMSDNITSQYIEIWNKKINANYGYIYVDGEERYFSDFNDALRYRYKKLEAEGVLKIFKDCFGKVKLKAKDLNNFPGRMDNIKEKLMSLYIDINEYANFSLSPQGSLISYSQRVAELSSQINRKFEELEILLP
jgi:hypothetical protein